MNERISEIFTDLIGREPYQDSERDDFHNDFRFVDGLFSSWLERQECHECKKKLIGHDCFRTTIPIANVVCCHRYSVIGSLRNEFVVRIRNNIIFFVRREVTNGCFCLVIWTFDLKCVGKFQVVKVFLVDAN